MNLLRAARAVALAMPAICTLALLSPAPASASSQLTATARVTVRSEATTSSRSLGLIEAGQTVTAVRTSQGWSTIRFHGRSAFVKASYLGKGTTRLAVKVSPGSVRTASTTVNVRSGAGLSESIVGKLPDGSQVTMTGTTSHGFGKVVFDGSTAWVSLQYLPRLYRTLPAVTGTRVATAELNLRTSSRSTAKTVGTVKKGSTLSVTGVVRNKRAQIVYKSASRWVTAKYLGSTGGTPQPAPSPGLPKVIGVRYATVELDIRSTYEDKYVAIDEVPTGTPLSITGVVKNERMQIVYKNAVRWVTAKYLSPLPPGQTLPLPPGLPKVIGVKYAATNLNIRSTYEDKYVLIAEVPPGTPLAITGVVKNGRMQVIYQNAVRWVTNKYLSTAPPTPGKGSKYAVERGLKPNAIKVHRALLVRYPQITTYYGVRKDPLPDHPSGRALDIMIPNYKSAAGKALGYDVAKYLKDNARSLGVNYVIWNQHIWNIQRDSEGWRYMANRGGDSANHKNHVHVTVYK